MKTFRNLILGFILLSVLSCGREQQPVLPRQEMAERLLMEADSLMRTDSAFWLAAVNRTHPAVCRYDSAIRKKLDNAMLMCPALKKVYLTKYVYLVRSWKPDEILLLLRKMATNVPDSIAADMWSLKAVLEDRAGFRDTAKHDFRKADSIYELTLRHYAKEQRDTMQYSAIRVMKALNLSLLYDNFQLLQHELELYRRVYETPLDGWEVLYTIESKEQYYRFVFGN